MTQPQIAVRPLRPSRPGAEVSGIDASDAAPVAIENLKSALAEHGAVVLRDQDLTPKQYVAFARLFGELEPSTREQYWHPVENDIYVISNIVENGRPIGNPNDGFGWHTDQYYFERPTAYTFLYGIETPPEGASHSKLNEGRLHPGQEEAYPDVVHDLVRKHPISGRRFLYFSGAVTSLPHDMSSDEFAALHRDLHARATQPDRVYSHKWRPKDLVIWDNRGVLHRATPYDKQHHRRLCHRLSVIGERPIK